MNEEQKKRASQLKVKQKERLLQEQIRKIKSEIKDDISDFEKKYTFLTDIQNIEIKAFLSKLPSLTPLRPDFEKLPCSKVLSFDDLKNKKSRVRMAFLEGDESLFKINVLGSLSDFVSDIDEWTYFGSYIIFIFQDMNRFIFIDDNYEITESCLEIRS